MKIVILLTLSGCVAPLPAGPAGHVTTILRDPARPLQERMDAALALAELGPEAKAAETALLQTLRSETGLDVSPSDPLARQLFGDDAGDAASGALRGLAAQVLSHFVPEPGSVPVLAELLRDENDLVGEAAGFALASLGAEARPAVPALVGMTRHESEAELATFVLARIAPDPSVEAAVPRLLAILNERQNLTARFNAAVALLKLGREEEKARAVIRDQLHLSFMLPLLESQQPLSRLHLCEALEHFGPPQRDILDLLRERAAEDPDARVREAALQALRKAAADERAAAPADPAPRVLPTLPPELADAARALIEQQATLGTKDGERLTGLRLLGGTLEGSSAEIDFFRWSGTIYSQGSVTMVREGGRWVHAGTSDYPGYSEPSLDESTTIGRNEAAALAALKAVAAAQIRHWDRSSSYAGSLAELDIPSRTPGYVLTLTAGAKSAWSAEAHPAAYPKTGIHSYYIDERGILLDADTRGLPLALEMPER